MKERRKTKRREEAYRIEAEREERRKYEGKVSKKGVVEKRK